MEVYSIPTTPATSQDLGFVTSSASPAFIPSEGEIVYPTTGSTEQEPALTIVNLPRHSYRKIGFLTTFYPSYQHDPTNAPHVGGNTWAGGTGGRDTAGLGGKGGPYRLDAGHPVYQVSDWEKENVPEEVCACTVYYCTFSCGQPQKVAKSRLIYILMFFVCLF